MEFEISAGVILSFECAAMGFGECLQALCAGQYLAAEGSTRGNLDLDDLPFLSVKRETQVSVLGGITSLICDFRLHCTICTPQSTTRH